MRIFLLLILAPISAISSAGIIDFTNRTAVLNNGEAFTTIDDFRFTLDKGGGYYQNQGSLLIGSNSNRVEADNDNLAMLGGTGFKPVLTLERTDGAAFSLGAIDVGGSSLSSTSRWAEKVIISDGLNNYEVTLNTSSTTYQSVSAQAIFSNVTSLTFAGINDVSSTAEFTLDNINLGDPGNNAGVVPEPSTFLCFGILMISLTGFSMRRRLPENLTVKCATLV